MRLAVSLLTAALFVTFAEASPKPSIVEQIKHPSLGQKHAGNCTTTCQNIGNQRICNTHCF
jgi:hypothetical protein